MLGVEFQPEVQRAALRLLWPLFWGEALFFVFNGLVTRRPPGLSHGPPLRRETAEILGRLRLRGRGLGLCITGASLHLAVVLAGSEVFPRSLVLAACSDEPSFWWLWGSVSLGCLGIASIISRDLYIDQADLVKSLLDAPMPVTAAEAETELQDVQSTIRRTRRARVLVRLLGWALVYLAIVLALLPC